MGSGRIFKGIPFFTNFVVGTSVAKYWGGYLQCVPRSRPRMNAGHPFLLPRYQEWYRRTSKGACLLAGKVQANFKERPID